MLQPVKRITPDDWKHRSGWPYCVAALQPLVTLDAPVLLDDFIERTFLYEEQSTVVHTQPWVGITHHPPDMPEWYMANKRLQCLTQNPRWAQSVKQLRLIITLGENAHRWWSQAYPMIPSVAIKHPTGSALLDWDQTQFLRQTNPRVLQVGWFLRNTHAIYQARVPQSFRKIHLLPTNGWAARMADRCQLHFKQRPECGEVFRVFRCDDIGYDLFLSDSVVLIEVLSAVANNTVVECIARNTPICLNRHPGPEYYLGADYPLFYDHFDDIERTLTTDNILAAHKYLQGMDKWWMRGAMFREQVQAACLQNVPECHGVGIPLSTQDELCDR